MGGIKSKNKSNQRAFPSHTPGLRDFNVCSNMPKLSLEFYSFSMLNEDVKKNYAFSKLIGEGEFGKIKEAYLLTNPFKKFAVKCIPIHNLLPKAADMFSEILMLRELDHPNIVKFHELYRDSKNFYIVMELCSGDNVYQRMVPQIRYPENYVSKIMYLAFSTVKYLHKSGIAHGDIKPENFVFANSSPYSHTKLVDFGFTKSITNNSLNSLKTRSGTLPYTAPELLVGACDERSDNWSLGVMMYVLLSGYYPFDFDNDEIYAKEIMKCRFTLSAGCWKDISKAAKDLIKKLLVIDVTKRYTASEALKHPFFDEVRDEFSKLQVDPQIVERLSNPPRYKPFKLQVIKTAIRFMEDEEQTLIKQHFNAIDLERNGFITDEALLRFLNLNGKQLTLDETRNLIKRAAHNASSLVLTYTEFVSITIDIKTFLHKKRLRLTFSLLEDGFGNITPDSLKMFYAKRGYFLKEYIIDDLIAEGDLNRDGEVDYNEFILMMKLD